MNQALRGAALSGLCLLCSSIPALAGAGRWTPIGPDGADVRTMALAPSGLLYAMAASSGEVEWLFASTDGAASWQRIQADLPRGCCRKLVVDPIDPRHLLGLANAVVHSLDGGRSWSELLAPDIPLDPHPWVDIDADPRTPGTLYALDVLDGPVKSTDAGQTWVPAALGFPAETAFFRLAIDRERPRTVYAVTSRGLFRTIDGGQLWQQLLLPAVGPLLDLEIAPSRPATVYLLADGRRLLRSRDRGTTWVDLLLPPGGEIEDFVVDPAADLHLFVTGVVGLWESLDGGERWTLAALELLPGDEPGTAVFELLADGSSPGRMWIALGASGVARSTDGGRGWASAVRRMARQGVRELELSRGGPDRLFALSTEGSKYWKSQDRGASWRFHRFPGFRVTAGALMDAADPRHLLVQAHDGAGAFLAKSRDGGATWTRVGALPAELVQLLWDVEDRRVLYGLTFDRFFRSRDGGRSWRESTAGLPAVCQPDFCPDGGMRRVVQDPSEPRRLYLIFESELFTSVDRGLSWRRLDAEPGDRVRELAIDPADPRRLYAGTCEGIFRSRDRGASWVRLEEGLPDPHTCWDALAIDPAAPRQVLALSSDGVLARSRNGGDRWQEAAQGLPLSALATDLVTDPLVPHRFLALTARGSVFEARFEP